MRIKVLSGGRKNIELSLSDAELNFQMRRIGIEETVPMPVSYTHLTLPTN